MEIILDADVIIRGEKNIFDLRGGLESRGEDRFEVAAITIAELWRGVERASGAHRTGRAKRDVFALKIVIPIDHDDHRRQFNCRARAGLNGSELLMETTKSLNSKRVTC